MSRVYVGNLDPRTSERELEDEFRVHGILRSVWVARKPPGYAFVEFDDRRDAADAIRSLDGKHGWRVEMSRSSGGGGVSRRRGGDDMNCYECGEPGHFARECRLRIGSAGFGSGTRRVSRSPPPRYRRSPSYGSRYSPPPRRYYSPRRYSISPPRYRSISPPSRYRYGSPPRYRSISPVHRYRSISPAAHRARSPSRSPPMMRRGRGSIYENGSPYSRTRYRSFSGSP